MLYQTFVVLDQFIAGLVRVILILGAMGRILSSSFSPLPSPLGRCNVQAVAGIVLAVAGHVVDVLILELPRSNSCPCLFLSAGSTSGDLWDGL